MVEEKTAAENNTGIPESKQAGSVSVSDSAPRPAPRKRRKKKVGRIIKKIIGFLILFAVLGALGYYVYTLFKKPAEVKSEALHEPIHRGSIQSMVTGSGITKAQDSAAVTLSAGGEVLEVFVKEGQWVNEGDKLYIINSEEAEKTVTTAQENVSDIQKKIDVIYDYYAKLTVKAPFAGKLIDAADINVGDSVALGTKIATLVDDSTMLLKLYFSYGYEDSIYVGQEASVSIPSAMETISGKVKEIQKVERISNEGTRLFEVTVEVKNPGTLTAGMAASAALDSGDGNKLYPYENGKLENCRSFDIKTGAAGDALTVDLINYSKVKEGEILLSMDSDIYDEQLVTLSDQMKTAGDTLKKAQNALNNYRAVAPRSGTVLSCALTPGQTVAAGTVAVNIADTSIMIVEAQIDEMNVSYVKPGMSCDLIQWGRNGEMHYPGIVDYVSLEATNNNGMSSFPAKITVQNPDGSLLTGMYVDYSMVAAQSDNCLIAPVQAVKYTESGACVFVMADTAPANALDAATLGLEVPEGYYAVPVEIGLSDDYGVEIISGVEEGTEVFTQFMKNNANSMGMGMG